MFGYAYSIIHFSPLVKLTGRYWRSVADVTLSRLAASVHGSVSLPQLRGCVMLSHHHCLAFGLLNVVEMLVCCNSPLQKKIANFYFGYFRQVVFSPTLKK